MKYSLTKLLLLENTVEDNLDLDFNDPNKIAIHGAGASSPGRGPANWAQSLFNNPNIDFMELDRKLADSILSSFGSSEVGDPGEKMILQHYLAGGGINTNRFMNYPTAPDESQGGSVMKVAEGQFPAIDLIGRRQPVINRSGNLSKFASATIGGLLKLEGSELSAKPGVVGVSAKASTGVEGGNPYSRTPALQGHSFTDEKLTTSLLSMAVFFLEKSNRLNKDEKDELKSLATQPKARQISEFSDLCVRKGITSIKLPVCGIAISVLPTIPASPQNVQSVRIGTETEMDVLTRAHIIAAMYENAPVETVELTLSQGVNPSMINPFGNNGKYGRLDFIELQRVYDLGPYVATMLEKGESEAEINSSKPSNLMSKHFSGRERAANSSERADVSALARAIGTLIEQKGQLRQSLGDLLDNQALSEYEKENIQYAQDNLLSELTAFLDVLNRAGSSLTAMSTDAGLGAEAADELEVLFLEEVSRSKELSTIMKNCSNTLKSLISHGKYAGIGAADQYGFQIKSSSTESAHVIQRTALAHAELYNQLLRAIGAKEIKLSGLREGAEVIDAKFKFIINALMNHLQSAFKSFLQLFKSLDAALLKIVNVPESELEADINKDGDVDGQDVEQLGKAMQKQAVQMESLSRGALIRRRYGRY